MSTEFFEQRCTFPIHLHPSRLGNVREGVEEQLNSLLMQYVDELGGIMLAYSDLALPSEPETNPLKCGFIFQERSFIHFTVQVKALTWRVKVGDRIEGVVNMVASDHIALLLHGAWNATIPLSGSLAPSTWQYDADKDRWLDTSIFTGDDTPAAAADEDDGIVVKQEPSGDKKLSKKELKKLERRRLRDVMLAATGRGPSSKQARPSAGVITRGVHIRFEVSAVQPSEDQFKITGLVVSKRNATERPLGLTGGFTYLAPLESAVPAPAVEEEAQPSQDADGDFDMSALAAVTAPSSAQKSAHATPAKSAPSPKLTPAASAPPKKVHTDKQQEKFLKKKEKLAQRMAMKEEAAATTTTSTTSNNTPSSPKPVKSEKKRKTVDGGNEEENGTKKKKSKKVKRES